MSRRLDDIWLVIERQGYASVWTVSINWDEAPRSRAMEQVMEYNILNFSTWEDDSTFEATFKKLLDRLGLFYK